MKYNNILLDWLGFTYYKENSEDLLKDFLHDFPEIESIMDEMVVLSSNKMHYSNCLAFNEYFHIRFDDTVSNKGVNVQISGTGIKDFFDLFGIDDISAMINLLDARYCRPSRLDLAFDDYSKRYTPYDYMTFQINGSIRSKMRKIGFFGSKDKGFTFYIGCRRKKVLRIYEKDKQSSGEIDSIRYEFELHENSAKEIWDLLKSTTLLSFGDLLLDSFCIVDRTMKNISMCKYDQDWIKFVKSSLSKSNVVIKRYKTEFKYKTWKENFEKNLAGQCKLYIKLEGRFAFNDVIRRSGLSNNAKIYLQNEGLYEHIYDLEFYD